MRSPLALLCTSLVLALLAPTARPDGPAAHPALARLDFDEVEPLRGTVVHIQVDPTAGADRPDVIGEELSALVEELEQRFDATIALPAGLAGSSSRAELDLIVLLDSDAWLAQRPERPTPTGAYFDADLGAVVTYDLAWPGSPRSKRLQGLRRALVDGFFATRGQAPPAWLAEGARQHVLAGLDDELAEPAARRSRVVDELLEGGLEQGFLLPVADLIQLGSSAALLELARSNTSELREAEAWTERRLDRLGDQAAELFDFLLRTAPGTTLDHLGALVRGETSSLPGAEDLPRAFWDDLLTAERALHRDFDPRRAPGPAAFRAAVDGLDLAAAGGLRPEPDDALAMALWLAREGQLAAARATLAPLAGDEAVDRHLAGITAVDELRGAYLQHLAAADEEAGRLRFEHDGRAVTAEVARVGLRSVYLAANTRDVERILIESLDIGELVERMEKEDPAFGDPAARAWAHALVGGKYKRSLTSAQKRDEQLNEDLEAVAGRLDHGRILARLATVADAATATDEQRLAAAAELLTQDRDSQLVQAELWRLDEACRSIFGARFDAADPLDLLTVPAERTGDRVRLTYDFTDEAQLLDWPTVTAYSPEFVALLPELDTPEPVRELDRKRGLALEGSQAFQHLLPFAGPLTLTYEFSFERTKKKRDATKHELDFLYGSICDDLGYNHVRTGQFGELDVVDVTSGANEHQTYEAPLDYELGQGYEVALELDADGNVATRLDDKPAFSGSGHGRSEGRVAFLVHSDRRAFLRSVTIEGVLPEDLTATRRVVVDAQMAALGFER